MRSRKCDESKKLISASNYCKNAITTAKMLLLQITAKTLKSTNTFGHRNCY